MGAFLGYTHVGCSHTRMETNAFIPLSVTPLFPVFWAFFLCDKFF